MRVAQLRRLLRTLPPDMKVLLEDLEGSFSAHEDDFEQLELTGQWGPKALVITPHKPPRTRHRPFKPAEKAHPMERVRAHQRWLASKPQRDTWCKYAKDRAASRYERPPLENQLAELLTQMTPERMHPLRLESTDRSLTAMYVKCHRCGLVHYSVSAEYARYTVEGMRHFLSMFTADEGVAFGKPSLDAYMRCFSCGADSAYFLRAQESDAPCGATIQPVVVER